LNLVAEPNDSNTRLLRADVECADYGFDEVLDQLEVRIADTSGSIDDENQINTNTSTFKV